MSFDSTINLNHIKEKLHRAEKFLDSNSKSKIFNRDYIDRSESDAISQAETLGLSRYDMEDILASAMKITGNMIKSTAESISTSKNTMTSGKHFESLEIPMETVNDFADAYAEVQRSFIDLMNSEHMFLRYSNKSPAELIKAYNRSSNDFAQYLSAVTKLTNSIIYFNAEAFRRSIISFYKGLGSYAEK
jgi:hypothetical protein